MKSIRFLKKLHAILEKPDYSNIISWDSSGTSFSIALLTEFTEKILPEFFKHNNLASFIRQLNIYEFRKTDSDNLSYSHPLFLRDEPELMFEIKRKETSLSIAKTKNPFVSALQKLVGLDEKSNMNSDHLSYVEQETEHLKNKNQELCHQLLSTKEKNSRIEKTLFILGSYFKGETTESFTKSKHIIKF